MKNLYTHEPGENEFQGLQFLFGVNPFQNGLMDVDIDVCMRLASDNDPMVSLRVNEAVRILGGNAFIHRKNLRNEEEELSKQVTRLRINLDKDIQEIAPECD